MVTGLSGGRHAPGGVIRLLLEEPDAETVRAFRAAVLGFRQWAGPPGPWNLRFIHDTELACMENKPCIGDV